VSSRLDELVRATPATRDRYVDFLRAASIVAVVFGHWFISINHLEGNIYSTTSAVGLTSGLWLGTWLFQVMPVFFFVGGFSNLVTYDAFRRRGEPTSAFVRSRLERLLRPSLVFLGFWLIVQVALHLFDVGGAAGPRLVGETHQQDSTAAWWWLRPVFIGLSTLVLAGIVALVGRFERPVRSPAT
jgi:fucose 4-O-acetylase-like acetyltransferase